MILKRIQSKKLLSLLLAAIMLFLMLPLTVFAETVSCDFTIAFTDGTVPVENTDYTFSNGVLTIKTSTPVTVGMAAGVTTTEQVIVIDTTNASADVTLDKIVIDTASKYYAMQIEGGNPCKLTLKGTSSLKNTYSYGSAIRTYDRGTSVTITADNGSLAVFNTGSNGAIVSEGKGDLTVDGNAVLTVESQNHVGINSCGMITVKGKANVTVTAKKDAIVAGNDSNSGIRIGENAVVTVLGGESGINGDGVYGQTIVISGNAKVTVSGTTDKGIENSYGAITIQDSAVVSVTGGKFGIFNNYYEQPLTISGKAQVTLTDNTSFGIKNDGTITISDDVILNVSGTKEGVYSADGSVTITGKAQIKVKDCSSWGILGSKNGLIISDNVKITAENAGSALKTGSKDTSNILISNNVEINITGGEDGIMHSGKAGTTFVIKDNVKISITDIEDDAIYSSNAKATICDDVQITVDGCATGIYNGADDDQTFDIKGNAKVLIDKTSDVAIDGYGTLSVSGNAVLKHTNGAANEYGSENDIIVSENGAVTLTSVDKKVLYGSYTVIPATGKYYKVTTGSNAENATSIYYNTEKTEKGKSSWYYFNAVSSDTMPAPTPTASFTATGDNSGTLTGVTSDMEYSVDGGTIWKAITGTTMDITDVTTENGIKVYQKGDGSTTSNSDIQTIAVTQPDMPESLSSTDCTTRENNNGSIDGVDDTMEYRKEGETVWTSIEDTEITGLSSGTYYIRYKADGTALASPAEEITIILDMITIETNELTQYSNGFLNGEGTSDDISLINEYIELADRLLNSDNLNEMQISAVEDSKETLKDALERIAETADKIKAVTDKAAEYDPTTVTSDDKEAITILIEEIAVLIEGQNTTASEKTALKQTKEEAEALIKVLDNVAGATSTENTEAAQDITSETVTPETLKKLKRT